MAGKGERSTSHRCWHFANPSAEHRRTFLDLVLPLCCPRARREGRAPRLVRQPGWGWIVHERAVPKRDSHADLWHQHGSSRQHSGGRTKAVMAIVSSTGVAHIRLTVTDIARAKAFYDEVFGFPVAVDQSARVDEPGVRESAADVYGGVVYQTPSGALLGLRPVAPAGQPFDSEHTGLDHLSFMVGSRDELLSARDALDQRGTQHGDIIDLTPFAIAILSFSDPDGI